MNDAVNAVLANADVFVLILLRTSGLIFSSPVFGRNYIPAQAKIGLAATLGYLFFTVAMRDGAVGAATVEYTTLLGFVLLCAGELLLGIALAFITNIFFSLTFIAGHMMDMQIGFGIVNVYDAQSNTQIPMMGNLLNVVMLVVFFGVDGHHRLIEIIQLTLQKLPVGSLTFSAGTGIMALEAFSRAFTLALMVAMPVVASGLVLEIAFGLLIRMVPQMNMFVVGVPIKIVVGFIVLMFTLPVFVGFSGRIFSEMFTGIENVFSTFVT
jgi:flagellar biosynthetic protein FliR